MYWGCVHIGPGPCYRLNCKFYVSTAWSKLLESFAIRTHFLFRYQAKLVSVPYFARPIVYHVEPNFVPSSRVYPFYRYNLLYFPKMTSNWLPWLCLFRWCIELNFLGSLSTSEFQLRSNPASFGWKIIFLSLFFIDPSQTR